MRLRPPQRLLPPLKGPHGVPVPLPQLRPLQLHDRRLLPHRLQGLSASLDDWLRLRSSAAASVDLRPPVSCAPAPRPLTPPRASARCCALASAMAARCAAILASAAMRSACSPVQSRRWVCSLSRLSAPPPAPAPRPSRPALRRQPSLQQPLPAASAAARAVESFFARSAATLAASSATSASNRRSNVSAPLARSLRPSLRKERETST